MGSDNGSKYRSLFRDFRKHGVITQFLVTPFGASFKAFLVCSAVTGMWFFFFWGPYKSNFADLFPVSQWLWLPLLLIITGLAPTLFHHQFIATHKREKYFNRFCSLAATLKDGQALAMAYVHLQRSVPKTLGPTEPSMETLLAQVQNQKTKRKLSQLWKDNLSNEINTTPYGLKVFAYLCVWIFSLSVPFVYWSFYQGYGLLGLLFVSWPILAIIYGPLKKINHFDDPQTHWYVQTDYLARVDSFFVNPQ